MSGRAGHPLSVEEQRDLMARVLDTAEVALRMGDMERCCKAIFVWAQRQEHLLAGEETWEDNRV